MGICRNQILKILMPCSSPEKSSNPDWKNIVINAGIMGGIAFFSAIVSQVEPVKAGASAGLAFCMSLAIQLGLVKEK